MHARKPACSATIFQHLSEPPAAPHPHPPPRLVPCTPPPCSATIFQHLSELPAAPGVAFHERAPDAMSLDDLQVGFGWCVGVCVGGKGG